MTTLANRRKIHCNKCGNETWHTQVFQHNITTAEDKEAGLSWGSNDRLYACCGCDNATLSHIDWFSECDDPAEYFYPPRLFRNVPEWIDIWNMDNEPIFLFKEIYTALHNGSNRLATMGIRTLFDIYIQQKVGDQGDFKSGIKELLKTGHITVNQQEIIEIAVDVGNASAHRSFSPDKTMLATVLDIAENLYHLEVLKSKALDVKKKTPPRPPKVKKKKDNNK